MKLITALAMILCLFGTAIAAPLTQAEVDEGRAKCRAIVDEREVKQDLLRNRCVGQLALRGFLEAQASGEEVTADIDETTAALAELNRRLANLNALPSAPPSPPSAPAPATIAPPANARVTFPVPVEPSRPPMLPTGDDLDPEPELTRAPPRPAPASEAPEANDTEDEAEGGGYVEAHPAAPESQLDKDIATCGIPIVEGEDDQARAELLCKLKALQRESERLNKKSGNDRGSQNTPPQPSQTIVAPPMPQGPVVFTPRGQYAAATYDDPQWVSRIEIQNLTGGAAHILPREDAVRLVVVKNGLPLRIIDAAGPSREVYADLDQDGEPDESAYSAVDPKMVDSIYTQTIKGDRIQLIWLARSGQRVAAPGVNENLWIVGGRSADIGPVLTGRTRIWSYGAGDTTYNY